MWSISFRHLSFSIDFWPTAFKDLITKCMVLRVATGLLIFLLPMRSEPPKWELRDFLVAGIKSDCWNGFIECEISWNSGLCQLINEKLANNIWRQVALLKTGQTMFRLAQTNYKTEGFWDRYLPITARSQQDSCNQSNNSSFYQWPTESVMSWKLAMCAVWAKIPLWKSFYQMTMATLLQVYKCSTKF